MKMVEEKEKVLRGAEEPKPKSSKGKIIFILILLALLAWVLMNTDVILGRVNDFFSGFGA